MPVSLCHGIASESVRVAVDGARRHTLRRGCKLPPPHGAPRVLKLYGLKVASFQLPLASISFVSSAWRLTRLTAYEAPLVTLKDFRVTCSTWPCVRGMGTGQGRGWLQPKHDANLRKYVRQAKNRHFRSPLEPAQQDHRGQATRTSRARAHTHTHTHTGEMAERKERETVAGQVVPVDDKKEICRPVRRFVDSGVEETKTIDPDDLRLKQRRPGE